MNNICIDCDFKSKATINLDENEKELLSCNHVMLSFRKGETVIRQGHFSSNITYLRKGLAKIHMKGPYYEQIIKIVKAPRYLGLPTTFGDKVNQYSVTVIEDAEICFIDNSTFRELLSSNINFTHEIIFNLCRYELDSFHKCANRTQKQTRGNIADVLIDFADNFYNSDVFNLPLNRDEIGNLVDTSRESVSRVLTEFNIDGIIRLTGKKVEILNKRSLQLISANG